MFTIECLTNSKTYYNIQLCCEKESLFILVEVLDSNTVIRQFMVSHGISNIYMPKDLGWSGFNKWVSKFTYD